MAHAELVPMGTLAAQLGDMLEVGAGPKGTRLVVDVPEVTLTSDRVNSWNAVWSPDGKWLYFLSDRHLVSLVGHPWGPRQPEPFFDRTVKLYQLALSPLLGNCCRFHPTCSAYAQEAIVKYGFFRGVFLGTRRLLRSHRGAGPAS